MSDLDPTDTPIQNDTQSTNNSQGKVRQAWDAWSSNPANNAFLLQTGLALLQPRSPGQSGVGQFANAIGQGAEAGGRNVEAQQAQQAQEAKESVQQQEADARTTNAEAYKAAVGEGGSKTDKMALAKLQGQIRSQAATTKGFQDWLSGKNIQVEDPIFDALKDEFPQLKNKGQLLRNPQALNKAKQLYNQNFTEPNDATGVSAPTQQIPPQQTLPPPQMYKGRLIRIDPARRAWVYEDGTPVVAQ